MTVKKPRSNTNKPSTVVKPAEAGTTLPAEVVEKASHDTSASKSPSDTAGIDAVNQQESVAGVMRRKRVWPD